jgi:YggT family protein
MGQFLYFLVSQALGILVWVIIANVILSWLIGFGVINIRHPVAGQIERFLDAVTRPVLAPFRRFIPPIGGLDITPLLAILVIQGIQAYLLPWIFRPIIAALGG